MAAVAPLLEVLVFDTLLGLFIGIAMSIGLLVDRRLVHLEKNNYVAQDVELVQRGLEEYRASRPHVAILGRVPGHDHLFGDLERHQENQEVAGVTIVPPGRAVLRERRQRPGPDSGKVVEQRELRAVVLDGEAMPYIDVTAVRMLDQLAAELKSDGLQLVPTRGLGQAP